MEERKTRCFIVNSDVNTKLAMELTGFFMQCKDENANALLIVNSAGGSIYACSQIFEVYKASGVHLTTIGIGILAACASCIFCMGDERILIPDSEFYINKPFLKFYEKIKISEETFRKKENKDGLWAFTEKEIEQYGITTRDSDGWFDIMVDAMKDDTRNGGKCFSFSGLFDNENAMAVIRYFVECKLNRQEKATIVINSPGGDISQLNNIVQAYKASGLHLTTLGAGEVGSCAAGLFCMGDERIVLPNTRFVVHHALNSIEKASIPVPVFEEKLDSLRYSDEILFTAYSKKTAINKNIFNRRCAGGKDWELSEAEIKKYNITTKDSSEWMNSLTEAMTARDDKEEI